MFRRGALVFFILFVTLFSFTLVSALPINFTINSTDNQNFSIAFNNVSTINSNLTITLYPLYGANNSFTGSGRSIYERLFSSNSDELIYNATDSSNRFVVSWNDTNSSQTYYLKATVTIGLDGELNKTTIYEYQAGSWVTICEDLSTLFPYCNIGNIQIKINSVQYPLGGLNKIVNMSVNKNGYANASFNRVYLSDGSFFYLPSSSEFPSLNYTIRFYNFSGSNSFNYTFYWNNTFVNYTLNEFDILPPTISTYSPFSNVSYYVNQSVYIHFSASDTNLANLSFNNGSANISYIAGSMVKLNFSSEGNYNITLYANDTSGNLAYQVITLRIMNLSSNSTILTNQTYYNIDSNPNITQLVIAYNSSIVNLTTTSNRSIFLNLTQLMNNNVVSLDSDLRITRIASSGYNYSITIYNGTNISGASGWAGKLLVPFLEDNSSYTSPSGSVNRAVSLGSDAEVSFTSPVKIIIGKMANKSAAWSSGSSILNDISRVCNSLTAPTNIDPVSYRECYINSSTDLAIWTYHFTTFAAYSPVVSAGGGGGGGGGGDGTTTSYVNISNSALANGYSARFIISNTVWKFNVNNVSHQFVLLNVNTVNQSAYIQIQSTLIRATIPVGETRKFDLIGTNKTYQLSVKINSINSNSANITLKSINESVNPIVNTTKTNTTVFNNNSKMAVPVNKSNSISNGTTNGDSTWFYIFIIILIFAAVGLMIGVYIYFKKSRNYTRAIKVQEVPVPSTP